MAAVGVGYDLGSSTYSPAGRVFQVEYAEKAVKSHGTVIGICCSDGVVLGVEKIIQSKMLVPSSYRRIYSLSKHAGLVMLLKNAIGGVLPDGRQLVARGREESVSYKKNFGVDITGKVLSSRIAMYVHAYTEYWHLRPFGVSCLLSCHDNTDGYSLYMIDPAGECYKYYGIAVGKGSQQARVELEKIDFKKLKCLDAAKKIAEIIYTIHDETKDKPFKLELSWISNKSNKQHQLLPDDIYNECIKAGENAAKDDDSGDEDEENNN